IKRIIADKYFFSSDFSKSSVISKSKLKNYGINDFTPYIEIKTFNDKENVINIQANFYCYVEHRKEIEQAYTRELINIINSEAFS
ncbi:mechanosensitive ion channel protein MscS, partial [Francisella tularensis subsp. holarctica]